MQRILQITCTFFISLVAFTGNAQKISSLPLTADSLATGNYKDVLKSFFQLAFNNLISQNKEIQFTSNPFAVMAKMDTTLLIDKNYIRYNHLRNLNFSFATKLDTAYKFNGFSSGIKYALINKRDETVSREFVTAAFEANNENNLLNNALTAYIATINISDPRRQLYTSQRNDLFSGKINFSQVDKDFQKTIRTKAEELKLENFLTLLNKDPNLNVGNLKKKNYESLRDLFQQGLLWTIGVSDTTYKDQFFFSNILLNTELVKDSANPGLDPISN